MPLRSARKLLLVGLIDLICEDFAGLDVYRFKVGEFLHRTRLPVIVVSNICRLQEGIGLPMGPEKGRD